MSSRQHLKRDICWMLAGKCAALVMLRFLFFPPAHEPVADAAATGRHLIRAHTIDAAGGSSAVSVPEKSFD